MDKYTIDIARQFSEVPAGRFGSDGDFNGERFRHEYLVPALREYHSIRVILDNTDGFGSSFLEEAFGGLVRKEGFTSDDLFTRIELVSTTARAKRYKRKAEECIRSARFGQQT